MKVIEYICCIENTDPYTLELQTAGLMWYVKKQRYTVVETQIDSIPNFDFRRDNLRETRMNQTLQQMGRRLYERRKQINLSQEMLAELASVTAQAISTAGFGKKAMR